MSDTWGSALELLKKRLDPTQFETWLRPIRSAGCTDGALVLEVPDEFTARWVRDNYLEHIKDALWDAERRHLGIDFRVRGDGTAAAADEGSSAGPGGHARHCCDALDRLVPRMTFDSFVVAMSNEVAFSACEMASMHPGLTYNPLFIYGGVGIGKTHLLQAVAHSLLARFPGMRVFYLTGESYVNEVMNAVKGNSLDLLRQRFRGRCDCLLVDDVHYLSGKEFAQEEFFHTFNDLYNGQKQVIVTCDQLPTAIPRLSERLRSRFGAGLMVDIGPPEPDLRMQVVLRKAGKEGIDLPEEVAEFLSVQFSASVRELEGALNRVAAHALIRRVPVTLPLARQVMDRIVSDRATRLTPDNVLKIVAEAFQVQVADLKSSRRAHEVSLPRQVAMHVLRHRAGTSLQEVGRLLGGRSHTTVMAGLARIEQQQASDPSLERAIKDIERRLGI